MAPMLSRIYCKKTKEIDHYAPILQTKHLQQCSIYLQCLGMAQFLLTMQTNFSLCSSSVSSTSLPAGQTVQQDEEPPSPARLPHLLRGHHSVRSEPSLHGRRQEETLPASRSEPRKGKVETNVRQKPVGW